MKRFILIITLLISFTFVNAQVLTPKGLKVGTVTIDPSELKLLDGLTTNIVTTSTGDVRYNKQSDNVSATTYIYLKTQIDSVIASYLTKYVIPTQNLVKQSENIENAVWSANSVTSTTNTAIDMLGNKTLETITANAAANNLRYHDGGTYLTVVPGTTYKVSFDCRRGTMTDMKYSVMDVTNSVIIKDATSYYSQTSATNVTRVSYTFTAPATCTQASIYLLRDSGAIGQTVYLGRVQVSSVVNAPYCTTTTFNVP